MTPARESYFRSLTATQRTKVAADARRALRTAWPHRNGRRARIVIAANVATLRDLEATS